MKQYKIYLTDGKDIFLASDRKREPLDNPKFYVDGDWRDKQYIIDKATDVADPKPSEKKKVAEKALTHPVKKTGRFKGVPEIAKSLKAEPLIITHGVPVEIIPTEEGEEILKNHPLISYVTEYAKLEQANARAMNLIEDKEFDSVPEAVPDNKGGIGILYDSKDPSKTKVVKLGKFPSPGDNALEVLVNAPEKSPEYTFPIFNGKKKCGRPKGYKLSEEAKKSIGEAHKGAKHHKSKGEYYANDVWYDSPSAAASACGIPVKTLYYRCKRGIMGYSFRSK